MINSEILITTGRVWRRSSDKWKAPLVMVLRSRALRARKELRYKVGSIICINKEETLSVGPSERLLSTLEKYKMLFFF